MLRKKKLLVQMLPEILFNLSAYNAWLALSFSVVTMRLSGNNRNSPNQERWRWPLQIVLQKLLKFLKLWEFIRLKFHCKRNSTFSSDTVKGTVLPFSYNSSHHYWLVGLAPLGTKRHKTFPSSLRSKAIVNIAVPVWYYQYHTGRG